MLILVDYVIMEELENALAALGCREISVNEAIIPCNARLQLQERLLERLEPGILTDADVNLPGTSQVSRLLTIYADLGIYCTPDVILGNCSQSMSLGLLLDLCHMLRTTDIPLGQCEFLISHISRNPTIFNCHIGLFPPTFPAKYPVSGNVMQDMEQILEYWEQEYERLKETWDLEEGKEQRLPSTEELRLLRGGIEEFCKEIKRFRREYEESLREYLGEPEEDNKGIGKWSRACISSYDKLQQLFQGIEEIWCSINILINK